jgi:hypothetical protein
MNQSEFEETKHSILQIYKLIENFYLMQADCRRYKQLKKLSINEFAKIKLFNRDMDEYLDKIQ